MRRRRGRVNRWVLVVLALVAVGCHWLVSRSARPVRSRLFYEKAAAVELSRRAFLLTAGLRHNLGFPVDSVNDPNGTALIGVQFSQTTFGRSDLSDALTTTNPNFSAALVEMLHRAGARRGDSVGVSWDGTYPALNVQLLAACRALGVVPVIATAQSAGMWGANLPGLSWLDIERQLVNAGLWEYRTAAAFLGGENDDGRGLSPEGRAELVAAVESAGVRLYLPESLEQGAAIRDSLFGCARVVVTLGRAVANYGGPLERVPSRLISERWRRTRYRGLVGRARERNIPVINISNPSQAARAYHLPVAPVPLPAPGKGRLFFEQRYSAVLAAVLAMVLLGLLVFVVRYDVEWYFGVRDDVLDREAV